MSPLLFKSNFSDTQLDSSSVVFPQQDIHTVLVALTTKVTLKLQSEVKKKKTYKVKHITCSKTGMYKCLVNVCQRIF